jgi:hypothetical protein
LVLFRGQLLAKAAVVVIAVVFKTAVGVIKPNKNSFKSVLGKIEMSSYVNKLTYHTHWSIPIVL